MNYTIRNNFIPDPGYYMAEFDYAQAEAMVVAWLANDFTTKNAFRNKEDVHSKMAAMLFDKDYDWIVNNLKTDKEAKLCRQTAKPVVHGFNYKMGPKALHKTMLKYELPYTYSDCKNFLMKMKKIRPVITNWHNQIQEEIKTKGYLITPLGFRRSFAGKLSDATYREAYAFIPQSTVGHMLNLAWLNVYDQLGGIVDILMNVHDSIVIQFKKENYSKELLIKIKELMTIPLEINGDTLIIPVDCKMGDRYGSMKEVDL